MRAQGMERLIGKLVLATGKPRSELLRWSKSDRIFALAAIRADLEDEARARGVG